MIMNQKSLVAIALLAVSAISSAQSVYPGQHQGKMKKETVAPVRVESFDLKDVCLLPSRFRDNMLRDSALDDLYRRKSPVIVSGQMPGLCRS